MALYEITSGNIQPNVLYEVVGGTSIVYNTVTYNAGQYFTGVSGVTTYTKTGGTEIVTEASQVISLNIEFVPIVALVYPEESQVTQLSIEMGVLEPVAVKSLYKNQFNTY